MVKQGRPRMWASMGMTWFMIVRLRKSSPYTPIFSHAYVQGGKVGCASFSETDSYISYSAPDPSWWLDNGSPLLVKKPFQDASFEASTRTFRAVIGWSPTVFARDVQQIYRIVFSADYTSVERGEVISYGEAGETKNMWVYGRSLIYLRQLRDDFGC